MTHHLTLFQQGEHLNVRLPDYGHGEMVQANQHLIVHNGEGILLDPGGHKVFAEVLGALSEFLPVGRLRYLFFSHQDPDIVAAANGWLATTQADAYCSELWLRFIPHFGVEDYFQDRLHGLPDEGGIIELGGKELWVLPAHFLHSAGNFHLYDPASQILYTGDVGASLAVDEDVFEDVEPHLASMAPFHQRYMAGNAACRAWVSMVRELPVETIAPQHGAMIHGPDQVARFLDWMEDLSCGMDRMAEVFRLPRRP